MKVVVVGGGISGLTTAFYIKKLNPNVNVTILEREEYLGGKIKSEYRDGFIFESGSNGFLSNRESTFEFIEDLNLSNLLLRSSDSARIRYIFDRDRLQRMPDSPVSFLSTSLLPISSKFRVLAEFFIKPKRDDSEESLKEFGYRRVGVEFTDIFLDAMSAGIFGSKPSILSVEAAFGKVVALEREYGGLFRGMLKKRKKEAGPSGVLMSFVGGMSLFIEKLELKLRDMGVEIFKNAEVRKVQKSTQKYYIDFQEIDVNRAFTVDANRVVLATPSFASAKFIRNFDSSLGSLLGDIRYIPMSIVGFGYREPNFNLDGFGLLTTSRAKRKILGVLWDSSIFYDRAKERDASLRVMIGGARDWELALKKDEELIEIAKSEIEYIMGVKTNPDIKYVKFWKDAIPSYEVGHKKRVQKIFSKLKEHRGLYLNSNAYRGVGFNDCIENSMEVAKRVSKSLER